MHGSTSLLFVYKYNSRIADCLLSGQRTLQIAPSNVDTYKKRSDLRTVGGALVATPLPSLTRGVLDHAHRAIMYCGVDCNARFHSPGMTIALIYACKLVYLTLGAHAHESYSTHFVCVCVCLEFATFNSRLYIKYDIPVYFSPVFLCFKFCRF